jgi:hypothetical protein
MGFENFGFLNTPLKQRKRLLICRNDASKGFYRLLKKFGMLRELNMNAEPSTIIKVAPFVLSPRRARD